jgi:RimJ/RimL family protein N-acetyltransferase
MFDAQCPWSCPPVHSAAFEPWTLRCGAMACLRPVRADDGCALEAMLLRQSRASRYNRFHSAINGLTPKQLARLTCSDDPLQLGLVLVIDGMEGTIVAEARFASDDGRSAEVAVIVDEAWRRRGIGWRALGVLSHAARERGLHSLHGRVLDTNDPMLALVRRAGWPMSRDADDARVRCFQHELDLGSTSQHLRQQ